MAIDLSCGTCTQTHTHTHTHTLHDVTKIKKKAEMSSDVLQLVHLPLNHSSVTAYYLILSQG